MYAKEPIRMVNYQPGEPYLDYCPYFDPQGYDFQDYKLPDVTPQCIVRGGVRHRLFFDNSDQASPVLNKMPLVRWRRGMAFWSGNHYLKPKLKISSSSGALLHFKFFAEFLDRIEQEVDRGVMFNSAIEYQRYYECLQSKPNLCPFGPNSVKFSGSRQLTDLGIIRAFDS